MAQASNRRLALLVLGLAGIAFLLSAGVASAKPSRAERVAGKGRVADARALRAGRCTARQRRLIRTVRHRRACAARGADASRAAHPLYWGATISDQLTGTQAPWDMTAVAKFEEMSRKPASLVQFFQPFSSCDDSGCSFYNFPDTPLENIRRHGSIPVLSWSSQSIPSSVSEPDYQLSDVIAGTYDDYIREFATKAKSWGHPFFLRFNWEMNGDWFPWSEGVNGNNPGEYVAAWRHVHDIFTAVGATNVSWVWCPNVEWNGTLANIAPTYPGDAYVDWTGLDGYNWGTNPARHGKWETFSELFRATYDEIAGSIAPSKPLMIAEVGSTEIGGSKASWIADMLARVPVEYPNVQALLWFDKFDDGMDWPIETSGAATSAFAEGIQSPAYIGNAYAELGPGPVLPPS
jgi:hypothetical protein